MRIFKKIVSVLTVAALALSGTVFTAHADEITDDGKFGYITDGVSVTITKYLDPDPVAVVPAEIDGLPVTTVGDGYGVFINDVRSSPVTSVELPDTVTAIGSYAFSYCDIESIDLPDGLTVIGTYAFDRCASLQSVAIPDGVTAINSYAFSRCPLLSSVFIPYGVTSISNNAFLNCTALTAIHIPQSVSEIGKTAFKGSGLTTVYGAPGSAAAGLASATVAFVPVPKFTDRQLALGSDLTMILYATYSDGGDTLTGEFGVGNIKKTVTAPKIGGEYVFRFEGITPQRMGETITATVSVDGLPTVTYKTSVRDYLLAVAAENGGNEVLLTLIDDILEYGAAAQKYIDPSLGDGELVNGGSPPDHGEFVPPASDKAKTEVNSVTGFGFTTAGLRFENVNKLFVKFTAGDGFRVTVNGDDITGDVTEDGGVYTVYTSGVPASRFASVYTFALYSGETLVQTLTYSVNSMVAAKYASPDEVTARLARATYYYGVSAAAYVASLT